VIASLLGHLSVLGAPMQAASNIASGNVVGGIASTTNRITNSVSSGVARLAFDEDYIKRRHLKKRYIAYQCVCLFR